MSNQTIIFFYSDKSFLSQWYPAKFKENEIEFSSAEQYMMYHKALCFHDVKTAEKILQTSDPRQQKLLGRQVRNFNNHIWTQQRKRIVKQGNRLKFQQNANLMSQLCQTKGVLAEASPGDSTWGIGMSATNPQALDRSKWGLNLLGTILVELRQEFLRRLL
jgi:ribA/ribD-fused uncharacterized protein